VLPPRSLSVDWGVAAEQVRSLLEGWSPFTIDLTEIKVFPVTDVIYLEVGSGAAELHEMNAVMNTNGLIFDEPFEYHPHVTLAQEVEHDRVPDLVGTARQQWADYRGQRSFRAERVAFVQNTTCNGWIDLAEYSLGAVTVP
jgi:2'-5' RNA ligase